MKLIELQQQIEDKMDEFVAVVNAQKFSADTLEWLNGAEVHITADDVDVRQHESGLEFVVESVEVNGYDCCIIAWAWGIRSEDSDFTFSSYSEITGIGKDAVVLEIN